MSRVSVQLIQIRYHLLNLCQTAPWFCDQSISCWYKAHRFPISSTTRSIMIKQSLDANYTDRSHPIRSRCGTANKQNSVIWFVINREKERAIYIYIYTRVYIYTRRNPERRLYDNSFRPYRFYTQVFDLVQRRNDAVNDSFLFNVGVRVCDTEHPEEYWSDTGRSREYNKKDTSIAGIGKSARPHASGWGRDAYHREYNILQSSLQLFF